MFVCVHAQVNVVIYSTSRQFKRRAGLFMLVFSLMGIWMTGMGFFNPYSMDDTNSPKPKRLFLVVSFKSSSEKLCSHSFLTYLIL